MLAYIHKSGTAHSIKDLEKALPSIASINGMQVKDYISALSDENKIYVEKIGSGNWYWSFPGEEKKSKEEALEKALEDRDRAHETVNEMKIRLEDIKATRGDEDTGARGDAIAKQAQLAKDITTLNEELASHAENDPVVLTRRQNDLNKAREEAERLTDQIVEMERYLMAEIGMETEQMRLLKTEVYGDEYSEEEEGLKELREP